MKKTQVCSWIAFCRKTKNEGRNLKSEKSQDYSQKLLQKCTFPWLPLDNALRLQGTQHIPRFYHPPATLFIDIPLILVSFSPKLCTVHKLQLKIQKMLVCEISYSAVPMKTRPPAGEFVSINYSTVYSLRMPPAAIYKLLPLCRVSTEDQRDRGGWSTSQSCT
jgi:hypothetical protein